MIIACPACATRYVVPDSAIGVEGRTVRCAKCRHSWFQDGPAIDVPAPPPPAPSPPAAAPAPEPVPVPQPEPAAAAPEPAPAAAVDYPPAEAPVPDEYPSSAPANELPESAAPVPPPPVYSDGYPADDDGHSSFAHEPLFRPRRNPAKMWTIAAVLFAVVSLGAVGATAWYGLPDWAPLARPTFAEEQPGLTLDFPAKRQDRRRLPNGTEYFGASGTVTNVSAQARSVPSLLIVLRDAKDRIVYSWEVVPPKRVLAPGESVTINEAVTDVPKSATAAEFGWKPG